MRVKSARRFVKTRHVRHYTKKEVDFDVEFRPSAQATAHGGQLAVAALAREYGLWTKVKAQPALDPRTDQHKGFEPMVYVAAFVFGFCSGAKSLADVGRLEADAALKELLGIKRFPDESALGEWLRHLQPAGGAALREAGARLLRLGFAAGGAGGGAPRRDAGSLLR